MKNRTHVRSHLSQPDDTQTANNGPSRRSVSSISGAFSFIKRHSASSVGNFDVTINPKKLAVAALIVFVIALGVRLLYYDDRTKRSELWDPLIPTGGVYVSEADRMVKFGFLAREMPPRGHARHILHPPGYLIYLIGVFKVVGWDDRPAIMAIQAVSDSITTVLILIFASVLANLRIGVLAGLLVAVSPHLAYSALFVSPESPFVLPVLLGVGCLYLAYRKNQIRYFLLAGAFFGLSCWLRSNGLALSPFFAVLMVLLSKDRRLAMKRGFAMILVSACLVAPITFRNYIVTGRFIPLSVGFGVILMQAVADYDFDKKYGLPKLDPEVAEKEAEWYNRPEYAGHFLRPDGIDRDYARIGRTLQVIKEHPLYYLSTVLRRIDFILRYDLPPGPDDWPFNTATPVYVSKHALYGHGPAQELTGTNEWSNESHDSSAGQGEGSSSYRYEVPVEKQNDYVVMISSEAPVGSGAWRVTNQAGDLELGSATIDPAAGATTAFLPFPSQNNTTVNIEFIADQSTRPPGVTQRARLIRIGTTPTSWTDPIRGVVRGIQRNFYETILMRVLIVAGALTLLLGGRKRALIWIAAVPLYFLMFQSLLHTEYRYILAAHYFLFILVAVGLVGMWTMCRSGSHFGRKGSNNETSRS